MKYTSLLCANCAMDLLAVNAMWFDGLPFCDHFCAKQHLFSSRYEGVVEELGAINEELAARRMQDVLPLTSGLHSDGTIHIYVDENDSGLSVGLLKDGTLVVKVGKSKRAMKVSA